MTQNLARGTSVEQFRIENHSRRGTAWNNDFGTIGTGLVQLLVQSNFN